MRSSPALADRVLCEVALLAVFVAALVGCRPSALPSLPSSPAPSVSCGALTKRDCEGYVEAARVTLNITESARVVADAGCPAVPYCNPPVRAWVAFIGDGDHLIGTVVVRGDPSGPPMVERWAGPLPSLPAH